MEEKRVEEKIQNFESELAWLPSGSRSNHDARLSIKLILFVVPYEGLVLFSFLLIKQNYKKKKLKDNNSLKKNNHFHGSTSSDFFTTKQAFVVLFFL